MIAELRRKAADTPNLDVIRAGFLSYEHQGAPAAGFEIADARSYDRRYGVYTCVER